MEWEKIASQVARGEDHSCTWDIVKEALPDFLDIHIEGEGVRKDVYLGYYTARLPQGIRGGQMFAPTPKYLGELSLREVVLVAEALLGARKFEDAGCQIF